MLAPSAGGQLQLSRSTASTYRRHGQRGFLCERDWTAQRKSCITIASPWSMTELVESLLEFSRPRILRRVFGPLEPASACRANRSCQPAFSGLQISVARNGKCETWFDRRKWARLFNLVLNACEAAPSESGAIEIDLREGKDDVEVRISDNGPGVAEPVRQRLFQPFTSYGKQNGIGLGLTISQKIMQDHGGAIILESSGGGRTVFCLTLPMRVTGDGPETN